MKIFRDDLPANVVRAHAILANAIPASLGYSEFSVPNVVLVTEISQSPEDVAALEFLESLGAVEHFEGTWFELTSAGECFRSLALLDVESS